MTAIQVPVTSTQILATLLLCGLMGVVGQGIRATLGLKNAPAVVGPDGLPTQQSQFNAAYFVISLMIGFIAGVLAGIAIGLDQLMQLDPSNMKLLLGIAAAGYAGADFIENSFARLVPGIGAALPGAPAPIAPTAPTAPMPPTAPMRAAMNLARVAEIAAAPAEIAGLQAALSTVAPKVSVARWTPALSAAFTQFGMLTHRRVAAALGQFMVEAGAGLQSLEEDLTYRDPARIRAKFPHQIASIEVAEMYVNEPEALGNHVYANRNGNGDEASGDGYRYRGRGLIQITGRTEYAKFATAVGQSVDEVVRYCETPEGAAMSGCWYLVVNNCLPLADAWSISRITRAVNGAGMSEAAERLAFFECRVEALGG